MFSLVPYTRKQNSLMSVFDEMLNDSFFNMPFGHSLQNNVFDAGLTMKTDIKETETELLFETELPGIKKEEINVKLENKLLTISVNRNEESNDEENGYVRKERKSGSYSRSFRVMNVKEDEAAAKYENGILKITLKKLEIEEPKKEKFIEIE